MKQPLVNIFTRTSGRPNGFRKCYESVKAQDYPNIRHIVSYDDEETLEYLKEYDDIVLLPIDKVEMALRDLDPDPMTGDFFVYNWYINEAYKLMDEGYFFGVDDDDMMASDDVISSLVAKADSDLVVQPEDVLVLGRFELENGMVIPNDKMYGKPPKICNIGGSCMFFHVKWFKYAQWDCWKCSDFRVINRLYQNVIETKFIDKVLVRCGNNGGLGKKKDV